MREQDDASGCSAVALPYELADGSVKAADVRCSALDDALRHLDLDEDDFAELRWRGLTNGTDAAAELVANSWRSDEAIADAIAAALGLRRGAIRGGDILAEPFEAAPRRMARVLHPGLVAAAFVAPRLEDIPATRAFLADHPETRSALSVTTLRDIEEARARRSCRSRLETARLSLASEAPALSARHTLTGSQGFLAACALFVLVALVLYALSASLAALHALAIPFYAACIGLRAAAALDMVKRTTHRERAASVVAADPGPPPAYTVLVALRDERADTIATLVAALSALRWPRSKLQILMVCEADDEATIGIVAAAIAGDARFRLVEVPPAFPRTKPKALNFALPLATGELVALFDAEDQPHPGQLEAAWAAFRAGGATLACVQAPLVVRNGDASWLSMHFGMEYAALFGGFLPWLARHGMPLPLGGTSNHFRRAHLEAVGAWDSHNVTEDADLGMRFARLGYRCGVIDCPTLEEAPEHWRVWRNQRTRWMKGWCQSWLVLMRDPWGLLREMGMRDFVVVQLLFLGMLTSSLAAIIVAALLLASAGDVALNGWPGGIAGALLLVDLALFVAGHTIHATLAVRCSARFGPVKTGRYVATLSAYWALVSLATGRAVWQLFTAPHLWEKTPHGRAAKADADDATAPLV